MSVAGIGAVTTTMRELITTTGTAEMWWAFGTGRVHDHEGKVRRVVAHALPRIGE